MNQNNNEAISNLNLNLNRNITNNTKQARINKGFLREGHKSIKKVSDTRQVLNKAFQESPLSNH